MPVCFNGLLHECISNHISNTIYVSGSQPLTNGWLEHSITVTATPSCHAPRRTPAAAPRSPDTVTLGTGSTAAVATALPWNFLHLCLVLFYGY